VLEFVRSRLPNGLPILVLRLPHVHAVSAALMVRAGPRYETGRDNGISHLVEHLVLRGTRTHPHSREFHVAVEAIGGEINGLTQRDACTIHITVPPRSAREGLRLLGEVCTEPTMDGIDIERKVVIEEILDTYDADGRDLDIDTLSRRILWPHPIGMPVAGEVPIVERLSEAACRAHFEKTFVAENSVLVISGRVDVDEMLAQAAASFGRMPRGQALVESASPIPNVGLPIHVQPSEDAQVSVLLSFDAPHEHDPEFPALLLLKRILDDGFGARLRQAIVEQRGIAYSLAAAIDAYADIAAFDVEIVCAEQKVQSAVRETLAVLSNLSDVSDAELDRAKTRHVSELEFALDVPSEIAGWYGSSALMGRNAVFEDWLAEAMRVTPADITALARRMFDPSKALLTMVGPVKTEDLPALERIMGRESDSTVTIDRDASQAEDEQEEETPEIALSA
jgi:predicted Zn-dependent peptidase